MRMLRTLARLLARFTDAIKVVTEYWPVHEDEKCIWCKKHPKCYVINSAHLLIVTETAVKCKFDRIQCFDVHYTFMAVRIRPHQTSSQSSHQITSFFIWNLSKACSGDFFFFSFRAFRHLVGYEKDGRIFKDGTNNKDKWRQEKYSEGIQLCSGWTFGLEYELSI